MNESFAFSPVCMGKELLMHLVNKNEDFQGPLMSQCGDSLRSRYKKQRVTFVAIFPFHFIYFHYPLKFRHRFAQYSDDTNCKVISALKFHVLTVIQKKNVIILALEIEIITKWIDMRYITFMQRHLASTQSQRECKINF